MSLEGTSISLNQNPQGSRRTFIAAKIRYGPSCLKCNLIFETEDISGKKNKIYEKTKSINLEQRRTRTHT
jgi:hypothetical protein